MQKTQHRPYNNKKELNKFNLPLLSARMEKSLSLVRSAERLNEGWLLIKRKMLFRSFMGKVTRAIFVQSARTERRCRSSSCARLERQPSIERACASRDRARESKSRKQNRSIVGLTNVSVL